MERDLKLGFAPTRRDVFSKEEALRHKGLIEERLKEWSLDFVNLDWLNEEGLLFSDSDTEKAADYFIREGVDALFCPHVNFGTESAVARMASRVRKPLLLWGPRDDAPLADGSRTRDTQCGLFATSKILRRFNLPFTYIVNSTVDSQTFQEGFFNFLGAANAVKAFRQMRIGQISTRPEGFWTVIYNEGELLEKFGIEVVPVSLPEITARAEEYLSENSPLLREGLKELAGKLDLADVSEGDVLKMLALKQALLDWAGEKQLSAIALQCWNALQDLLGIMPCFINGELTDLGLPVTCETDVHGAVTAVLARAAVLGRTAPFIADLTVRHPGNDNAELLWHCGNFPYSLKAGDGQGRLGRHFILPGEKPGTGEWEIKGGEVTIVRFDGDNGEYRLFLGKGRGTGGPATRGTYLWLEVNNWPEWEKRFIYGPYIHHVIGIHGDARPALREAVKYIPGLAVELVD